MNVVVDLCLLAATGVLIWRLIHAERADRQDNVVDLELVRAIRRHPSYRHPSNVRVLRSGLREW